MKFRLFSILCLLLSVSVGAQTYQVGDLIVNSDGSKGVVFWINAEGNAGWMVALHDLPLSLSWGKSGDDVPGLENVGESSAVNEVSKIFEALADTAGYTNTRKMREYWGEGNSWPAQVVDFENGWYIPAAGQMRRLYTTFLFIRQAVLSKGGDDFKDGLYWTSTEHNAQNAWYVYCNPGELNFSLKKGAHYVRPVRSFRLRRAEHDRSLSYDWGTGVTSPSRVVSPSKATEYTVEVTSAEGCTNRATHSVFVASGRDTLIVASLCPGERYMENGFDVFKTDTTYTRVLESPEGCSMQITLALYGKEPVVKEIKGSICDGEVYTENNFTAWEAGRYIQRWTGRNGCDSTVVLDVTVNPVYQHTLPVTICDGESYDLNGISYTTAGTYRIPLLSSCGCDSLVTLELTVLPVARDTIHASICEGDVYRDPDFQVSEGGFYRDTLQSAEGCDSIRILDLTVFPVIRDTFSAFICRGELYEGLGFRKSEAGLYSDTLQSRYACDSIVTLDLTVGDVYREDLEESICEGERYTQHGFDLRETGIYTQTLHSVAGCDSLLTLSLTVNPVYCFDFSAQICEGETYLFRGKEYSEQRLYEERLVSSQGCDSIYRLNLTVLPVFRDTIRASVCQGEVYEGFGFHASKAGFYSDTLQSRYLCDSIVTLVLTVNPVYQDTFPVFLCEGENYTAQGNRYSTSGVYSFSYTSVCGCDSLVTVLLTVNPEYQDTVKAAICEGEDYRFAGSDLSEEGRYDLLLHSRSGCDSLVTLFLKVHPAYLFTSSADICEGEPYVFRGQEIREAGLYEDLLTTKAGCDSLYRLELKVHPLYHRIIDTAVCEGEVYHQHGFSESKEGTYLQRQHSVYGCDSLISLHLRVIERFKGFPEVTLQDCRSHHYLFSVESSGSAPDGADLYRWDFGDGNTSFLENPGHLYSEPGLYPVTLYVIREGKCRDSLEYLLTVPSYSEDFGIEVTPEAIDEEWNEIRFRTRCEADRSYEWEMGDGSVFRGCEGSYQYVPDERSFYEIKLTVRNADSCEVERFFRLPVYHAVNPPNTFSPNGDGINDFFMTGYRLRIIDRNGLEIYRGDNGWDGTYRGDPVPEDTYFYELFYPTARGIRSKTGYITVVR